MSIVDLPRTAVVRAAAPRSEATAVAQSRDGRTAPVGGNRRGWGRRVLRVLAIVLLVVAVATVGLLGWLATGDEADLSDLEAALAGYDVAVTYDDDIMTISPVSGVSTDAVGIAFLPGTRVQREAYVATWAPIVEATGVAVHMAAVPLNLPALASDPFTQIIAAHPETSTWVVGGHSMGGFEAAAFAESAEVTPAGLLLWASGPKGSDLAGTDITTLLVAGASDAVLPPDRLVDEELLAADTTIEIIDGMVDGQFGRYSDTEAPLDPERRSDADTLADLVAATTTFIEDVTAA